MFFLGYISVIELHNWWRMRAATDPTGTSSRQIRFRLFEPLALAAIVLAFVSPTSALAQHRARVAKNLQPLIAAKSADEIQTVVQVPQAEVDRLSKMYGVRVAERLEMGALLKGSAALFDALANDEAVHALSANDTVMSTMAVATQSTGANQLWADSNGRRYFDGATGAGVGVAIIDSGIAPHDDLARRVRLALDFTKSEAGAVDTYGHGTHLAGIVAGSGRGSKNSEGTAYLGMAPGADLISLKVLGSDGTGEVVTVIRAIEWVIANRARYKIRVVNLSLGHVATSSYRDDPLAQAVERAVAAGLVVVSSAGNWGKTEDGTPIVGAIVSPGFTPGALTVGAMNTKKTVSRADDTMATYSSRGPVGDPDDQSTWEIKPDVVAPGNAIVATGLTGTHLYDTYPDRRVAGDNGGTYLTLSGASMATAVVSGAVAQLLQLQPGLSPAQVKFALQYTAEPLDGFGLFDQGAGSINVALAASLVRERYVFSAPTENTIAGETIKGGGIAFGTALPQVVEVSANGLYWGGRNGVSGDGLYWGGRNGVSGDGLYWGGRGVSGDGLYWGGRGVSGDGLYWGGRNGVSGDGLYWGGRGVSGDGLYWGGRSGVSGDALSGRSADNLLTLRADSLVISPERLLRK